MLNNPALSFQQESKGLHFMAQLGLAPLGGQRGLVVKLVEFSQFDGHRMMSLSWLKWSNSHSLMDIEW